MSEKKEIRTAEEIIKADLDGIYIGNLNTVEADKVITLNGNNCSSITMTTR